MQGAELQCLTEKSNGSERNRRGANKGRREVAERWTEILKTRTRWNVAVREIKRIGPHPERGRVAQCDAIVNGYSTRTRSGADSGRARPAVHASAHCRDMARSACSRGRPRGDSGPWVSILGSCGCSKPEVIRAVVLQRRLQLLGWDCGGPSAEPSVAMTSAQSPDRMCRAQASWGG